MQSCNVSHAHPKIQLLSPPTCPKGPNLEKNKKGISLENLKNIHALRLALHQKSLGVHKILVRKIWFYHPHPPPKMAQNDENCTNLKKLTLFSGGGERNFMDKTILWLGRHQQ